MSFKDEARFSPWAAEAIAEAAGLGLVKGRSGNVFLPDAELSRAESAQAIYNLLSK
ncbi:S-layer homology domain-containing protein [Paenibacillus darwinianus]|uniref:S-layer homology domain-containing protein n=1 Tax=Paenibacillus darwinianus TaxID=1380763 RepID=UPI000A7B4FCA